MGVPNGDLEGLERRRLELEGNVRKLQESLYHWRTWEAEYDGLKDEISELNADATIDDFLRIGRDFGGTLVTEDEVKVLLGGNNGVTRSRKQVVDMIARRIDYVKQNAATMEKRLQTAENLLGELDLLEQVPTDNGREFPMTEIMEELDEEGNVVSSSVNTPGDHATELLDILKKAGVKDIPDLPKEEAKTTEPQITEVKDEEDDLQTEEKLEHVDSQQDSRKPTPVTAGGISRDGQTGGPTPTSVAKPSGIYEEQPVTEVDESPSDAELRRELLEYGLNEVGAVVAELELDDDASDVSFDDGSGSYEYDSEEDEEEDEYGRSTRRVLDEDYHQQMRELEAKLNARGMYNVGKDAAVLPDNVRQDLEQRSEMSDKLDSEKKQKKKVAFAEDIDIAPAPKQPPPEEKAAPRQPDISPMSDSIVERAEPTQKEPTTTDPPKKASRFKSARHTSNKNTADDAPIPPSNTIAHPPEVRSTRQPNTPSPSSLPLFPAKPSEPKPFSQPISDTTESPSAPRPPEDRILADKLVERENKAPAEAPEPDELDEKLHRKEIATEFYQMRNRMIQRNGGFVNNDEQETIPIEPEEPPKRVSKFKAARMG